MTARPVATISEYPNARWWAAAGIITVIVGAVLSTAWFVWRLAAVNDGVDALTRVTASGSGAELVVEEAVDWTIYLEPGDRSLSGVRFDIVESESQTRVELAAAPNDVGYDVGEHSGRPVSRAQLEPGRYTVTVSPADAGLALGPDVGSTVQWMWWGALLIALPTVVVGGVVASVNVIRHLRTPVRVLPPPPNPPTGHDPTAGDHS